MATGRSTFHLKKASTAYQLELFVINNFQETEGQNALGAGWGAKRGPNTPNILNNS